MLYIQVTKFDPYPTDNWVLDFFLDEGGDDLKMKAWDIRQGFTHPMFVNKK